MGQDYILAVGIRRHSIACPLHDLFSRAELHCYDIDSTAVDFIFHNDILEMPWFETLILPAGEKIGAEKTVESGSSAIIDM